MTTYTHAHTYIDFPCFLFLFTGNKTTYVFCVWNTSTSIVAQESNFPKLLLKVDEEMKDNGMANALIIINTHLCYETDIEQKQMDLFLSAFFEEILATVFCKLFDIPVDLNNSLGAYLYVKLYT